MTKSLVFVESVDSEIGDPPEEFPESAIFDEPEFKEEEDEEDDDEESWDEGFKSDFFEGSVLEEFEDNDEEEEDDESLNDFPESVTFDGSNVEEDGLLKSEVFDPPAELDPLTSFAD